MTRVAGALLAAHGAGTLLVDPLRQRARRMQAHGYAPGLPHAVLVPLLELAAGTAMTRTGVPALLGAAAATALGAVRTGADLDDRTRTAGTVAAAGLTAAGAGAVITATRGRARSSFLVVIGSVVAFELIRRRRVLHTA